MLQKGDLITICPGCRHVVRRNQLIKTTRPLPTYDKADEIGYTCPYCNMFNHSYFLNDVLRSMHLRDVSRQYKREYKKRFEKYQRIMRKRYYPSDRIRQGYDLTTNQSHQSKENDLKQIRKEFESANIGQANKG